jgi:hypothetical protein
MQPTNKSIFIFIACVAWTALFASNGPHPNRSGLEKKNSNCGVLKPLRKFDSPWNGRLQSHFYKNSSHGNKPLYCHTTWRPLVRIAATTTKVSLPEQRNLPHCLSELRIASSPGRGDNETRRLTAIQRCRLCCCIAGYDMHYPSYAKQIPIQSKRR